MCATRVRGAKQDLGIDAAKQRELVRLTFGLRLCVCVCVCARARVCVRVCVRAYVRV